MLKKEDRLRRGLYWRRILTHGLAFTKVLSVETVVVPHQLVETGAYASGARKRRVKKGAVEEVAVSFHRWDHVLRVWYDANDADNKATGHAGAEPMRLVRSDVLTSLDQSLCCPIS